MKLFGLPFRVFLVGILVTMLASARTSQVASAKRAAAGTIRIGFVLPDLANPFIAGIRDGALAEAKKHNVTVLVKGTNDAAGQTNALLAYIGAKVNVVSVDAIDTNAIVPAVRAANKAHIPVIAIQAQPAKGTVATFIAADNRQGGVLIGQGIAQYCASISSCKVGIVEGDLSDQSGRDEDSGMRSVVGQHSNIHIVGAQPTNYDPAKALNVATNLLTANPGLNYIYSWWDQGAEASVQAARSAGKVGKIGISGFGGNCLNLKDVIAGNIYQETVFFPQFMGALMVRKALQAVQGKHLRARTAAPIVSITHPLALAYLSGHTAPPKKLASQIMQKLRDTKAGRCS